MELDAKANGKNHPPDPGWERKTQEESPAGNHLQNATSLL